MKKTILKRALALILCLLCLPLSGCGQKAAERQLFSMDTVMTLTAYGKGADAALDAAAAEIDRLNSSLSVTHSASAVYALNEQGGGSLSPELAGLLSRALEICQMTGGAFDISLLPLSRLWGFYGENPAVPSDEALSAALACSGYEKLTLSQDSLRFSADGMGIDLGGIAKGYTAAALLELLKQQGVESAILSLGGNVQTLGSKPDGSPWTIAIQDPFDPNAYIATLRCGETAVVTSGAYQRNFEENGILYHHILDPETGRPAESGLASVTIVSPDAVLADGLSTALFVMGPDRAADFWRSHSTEFQAVLIASDGSISITAGLEGSFQYSGSYEVIRL